MKALRPQDTTFRHMESVHTPMHIGSLLIFRLPDDAPPEFLRDFVSRLRSQPFAPFPFNCRLSGTLLSRLLPTWEETDCDLDYHVRHSALPHPGGERELGALVARLHSHPMDLGRPLWECHVIEGLENRRFGFYFKMHHCAIDGVGGMEMLRSWLSTDPADQSGPTLKPPPAAVSANAATASGLASFTKTWGRRLQTLRKVKVCLQQLNDGEDSMLALGRRTPRTLFNVPITQQRRLGTQTLPLARLKALSVATGATLNDVVLAVVSGVVRRYLLEQGMLPKETLTASVPIGIPRTDASTGNAVSGFVATLATDEPDPARRLARIRTHTYRTKAQMLRYSPEVLEQLGMVGLAPMMLGQMSGLLAKLPPFFNFVVSNVVLSKQKLYLHGAELEAIYPISFLLDGYALNVTVVGYADSVCFGFIGCRDAVPSLQKLAVYTPEALAELEQAVLAKPGTLRSAA